MHSSFKALLRFLLAYAKYTKILYKGVDVSLNAIFNMFTWNLMHVKVSDDPLRMGYWINFATDQSSCLSIQLALAQKLANAIQEAS